MKNKKAQVMDNLAGLGVGIATFAIIITVALLVMSNTKTQLGSMTGGACDNSSHLYNASSAAGVCCVNTTVCTGVNGGYGGTSAAWNSTGTLQNATSTIPGWIPLIVIVAIGAVILGMVAMFRR